MTAAAQLGETCALLESLVERIDVGIFAVDRSGTVALWNTFMAVHSGKSSAVVRGQNLFTVFPELPRPWLEKKLESVFVLGNNAYTLWDLRPYLFRFPNNRPITGGLAEMRQNVTFLPIRIAGGEVGLVCGTVFDYTDTALAQHKLHDAIAALHQEKDAQAQLIVKLEAAQNQLLQSEKMASIGQLAAGIAHEINNPIGFVNSNLQTLKKYCQQMLQLISTYQEGEAQIGNVQLRGELSALTQSMDFDFLQQDLPELIKESENGLLRIKKIVEDLKDFSHVNKSDWQYADLNAGLDSTLNVVWNEVKYKATVNKNYGSLPAVECLAAQLNQVFMNLIINAVQALDESRGMGTITLSTGHQDEWVWVEVKDNGRGMSAETKKRLFEPFFTTKPVGKGTGLGMSVSYNIVQKHHGRIELDSLAGEGTRFRVWVPVKQTSIAD
ncbi:MAG: Sensor protein ZraS [Candidatus Accumulibacter appositus]|uniref:histidine kinase n=1 Tax=Candidatus Accumulibacter appositus TaxID=1454003 RepID=A0A011PKN3_9PROT|nr:ATP-binding protein [Accumulibacter sp.]EXI77597.1 MAG: Sensor protein ZraS [Candidatus Accumulibacter appositus]HRF03947.1 ATP-binding protein [Accumulibacter sp.]